MCHFQVTGCDKLLSKAMSINAVFALLTSFCYFLIKWKFHLKNALKLSDVRAYNLIDFERNSPNTLFQFDSCESLIFTVLVSIKESQYLRKFNSTCLFTDRLILKYIRTIFLESYFFFFSNY